MTRLEQANSESQAARRDQYLKMAQMLGSFELPDRRGQGLDLLHKAVELGIPRDERPAFRDEAVKFLVLRDVVTRARADHGARQRPELRAAGASALGPLG